MKHLFTAFLLFTFFTTFGQVNQSITTVNFCGKEFTVPTDSKAPNEYEVSGRDYAMNWLYMNQDMPSMQLDKTVEIIAERVENFNKVPTTCFLLGSVAKGYKISYTTASGTAHQLIAAGNVNGQAVLVQLLLPGVLQSNQDIPMFARQIIRLTF